MVCDYCNLQSLHTTACASTWLCPFLVKRPGRKDTLAEPQRTAHVRRARACQRVGFCIPCVYALPGSCALHPTSASASPPNPTPGLIIKDARIENGWLQRGMREPVSRPKKLAASSLTHRCRAGPACFASTPSGRFLFFDSDSLPRAARRPRQVHPFRPRVSDRRRVPTRPIPASHYMPVCLTCMILRYERYAIIVPSICLRT